MSWITPIVLFEGFILLNIDFDTMKINKGWIISIPWGNIRPGTLDHRWEGGVQFIVAIIAALCSPWGSWWHVVPNLIFYLTLFWLQFDYGLNYNRDKDWWYLGDTWFDKILKGRELRFYRLALKIILFIGSVWVLMVI